jgi:hypothetical protein
MIEKRSKKYLQNDFTTYEGPLQLVVTTKKHSRPRLEEKDHQ